MSELVGWVPCSVCDAMAASGTVVVGGETMAVCKRCANPKPKAVRETYAYALGPGMIGYRNVAGGVPTGAIPMRAPGGRSLDAVPGTFEPFPEKPRDVLPPGLG